MLRTSARAALKAGAHLRLEIVQHKQNQGASWGETLQEYIHNIHNIYLVWFDFAKNSYLRLRRPEDGGCNKI